MQEDKAAERRKQLRTTINNGTKLRADVHKYYASITGKATTDNVVSRLASKVATAEIELGLLDFAINNHPRLETPYEAAERVKAEIEEQMSKEKEASLPPIKEPSYPKRCPFIGCAVEANNEEEVAELFGWRKMRSSKGKETRMAQSRCRQHRSS